MPGFSHRWYSLLMIGLMALPGLANCAARSVPTPSVSPSPAGPATVVFLPVEKPAATVTVEIADTRESRTKGLMGRSSLGKDSGMLFIMAAEADHTFWMKDTLIPLDMLFISRELLVVGIVANAEPLSQTLRSVGTPSSYVVEVNGGYTGDHGIRTGTPVHFVNMPPRTAPR